MTSLLKGRPLDLEMLNEYLSIAKYIILYFRPQAWIALGTASLLYFLLPEAKDIWLLVINFSLLFLFVKVCVIIHEMGHLTLAWLVGGLPKRMLLGSGAEVYRFNLKGIKIVLNSVPSGGAAIAIFPDHLKSRWRYILYFAGGVLFNLLAALLVLFTIGFNPSFITNSNGVEAAAIFISVNSLMLLNLIPFYSSSFGFRVASDGLSIIKALTAKSSELSSLSQQELFFEAYEKLEANECEEAYTLFKKLHESQPDQLIVLFNLSSACLKMANFNEGLHWLNLIETKLNKQNRKQWNGFLNNNLAWAHILMNDPDKAYQYAKIAIKDLSKSHFVQGTYGAALVLNGKDAEALQWLEPNFNSKRPDTVSLSAAIHLMVAHLRLGDKKKSESYRKFVEANTSTLESDVRLLWERYETKVE